MAKKQPRETAEARACRKVVRAREHELDLMREIWKRLYSQQERLRGEPAAENTVLVANWGPLLGDPDQLTGEQIDAAINALEAITAKAQRLASREATGPPRQDVWAEADAQKSASERIRIDLNEFSNTGSLRFLQDLIKDAQTAHQGIAVDDKKHGSNQPDNLKETLGRKELRQVANAITKTKGTTRRWSLNLSADQMNVVPRTK